MNYRVRVILVIGAIMLLSGCVAPPNPKNYAAFRAADPHSVLIVPAINRSVEVDAPDYFLSTITRPVAERGYYVFPVNLVKHLLEDDGLSDANLVHQGDPKRIGEIFGADAILYVTIERWDAQYIVFSTTTTVEISYVLKDAKIGGELWSNHAKVVYQPQGSNSGNPLATLIAEAIVSAIQKAAPNYMPLARQANAVAVLPPHQGLPAGPHSALYQKDADKY